jgi:hypothetical protein
LTKTEINASKKEVKKFGITFGILCIAVAAYSLYHKGTAWQWLSIGSAFFFLTGLFGYSVLRPIYIWWMKFAFALGWINTRILLGLFFYLIVTPVAMVMRLLGKDIIDKKFDRTATSYWKKREKLAFDPARYERLF